MKSRADGIKKPKSDDGRNHSHENCGEERKSMQHVGMMPRPFDHKLRDGKS